ncbi:RDD family protein [Corynebacterium ciconiae DSM 44920]|uniref:RDD family protein n=1 Tax=Corynebacterium ciconiae TaxID=227319 RepID=UPI0003654F9C|nr:RDD family protein [Corynebacterium ciconiae]WKD61856.1 RDD family protein [Corynebacterium ciconiae DSM 44920]
MSYQHVASEPVVDIYGLLGLDRDRNSALRRLCTIDAELELDGLDCEQSPRREVRILIDIMDDADSQREYDEKALGRPCSWKELDTLAKIGELPDDLAARPHSGSGFTLPPQGQPQVATAPGQAVPGMPNMAQPQHGMMPYGPAGYVTGAEGAIQDPLERRPGPGVRFVCGAGDWMVAMTATELVQAAAGVSDVQPVASTLIALVVLIAYVCGSETLLGATPVKLAAGYRTKDVRTGQNLTVAQSLKRSWWKFFMAQPALAVVSMIAGAVCLFSITGQRGNVAKHDELVHGEVVRKRFVEDN